MGGRGGEFCDFFLMGVPPPRDSFRGLSRRDVSFIGHGKVYFFFITLEYSPLILLLFSLNPLLFFLEGSFKS